MTAEVLGDLGHGGAYSDLGPCASTGRRGLYRGSASTASNAFRAAMSTGSQTGANGGA
jgi:hypothetical protein